MKLTLYYFNYLNHTNKQPNLSLITYHYLLIDAVIDADNR